VAAAQRTPEPTTNAEAQQLKLFLQRGASTSLELIQSFESRETLTVFLGEPASLTFDVTGNDLLSALAESTDREATLSIDVSDVASDGDFFVHVFVNDDGASMQTPPSDPHFLGGIAFFCRVLGADGRFVCIPAGTSYRYHLALTPSLQRIENSADPLHVTIVLVPFSDRVPQARAMSVTAAAVTVFRSVVKPAS
jgi:hypothetical protein